MRERRRKGVGGRGHHERAGGRGGETGRIERTKRRSTKGKTEGVRGRDNGYVEKEERRAGQDTRKVCRQVKRTGEMMGALEVREWLEGWNKNLKEVLKESIARKWEY